MTTQFSSKQPYEAYAISFDFSAVLGVESVASAVITAIDQVDSSDASLIILDVTKQIVSSPIVYGWVRAGTSGHEYLITCRIVGTDAAQYELDGILPVADIPAQGVSPSSVGWGMVLSPISEPVTLDELKTHLKIDSGTLADNLTEVQSIAPGSHATTTLYSLVGTAVPITSDTALVMVQAGTNQATGTVDIKIQESDTGSAPWTDWTGGAFTQITTANDNATYEKEYTGNKAYIRTAAQVLLAACEFGTTIIQYAPTSAEDALLTTILAAARQHVENITGRQLMTATWDYSLQAWPDKNSIKLPYGNLQSVSSLKYIDSAGTVTTMTAGTDYEVVTNGEQCGKIVLPYGGSWPSAALYPENAIVIRYVCGYASAVAVPEMLKVAIKFAAQNMWRHGGDDKAMKELVGTLTYNYRLFDEF